MNTQNLTQGAFRLTAGMLSLGLAGFFTLAAGLASASPLYENDFTGNTGYGTLPADWSAVAHTDQSGSGGLVDNTLSIRPVAGSFNTRFRGFALADSVGGNWDDYTVSTTFRMSVSTLNTPVLFGRWDNEISESTSGSVGGYALALSGFGSVFALAKDPGHDIRSSDFAGILASAPLDSFMPGGADRLDLDTWYTFELKMDGSNLTGRLYEGTDTSGTLRHTLTATDSTYTQGSVGLGAGFGSDSDARTVQFDNITVIPEPGTLMLMGLSALALLFTRRCKK